MEYPVTLPDHAFVIASISIYASRETNEDGLTYSGQTHASILSLKHNKADSYTGLKNLNFILGLDYFKLFLKQNNGDMKPILVFRSEAYIGVHQGRTWWSSISNNTKSSNYVFSRKRYRFYCCCFQCSWSFRLSFYWTINGTIVKATSRYGASTWYL